MSTPTIEDLLGEERWADARKRIRHDLRSNPDDHWLCTRLGLTYYEERRYRLALRYSERALRLAPACPLVLWEHAGTLQMLDRHREALSIYSRLVGRGAERIARDECGEGLAWARGLVADCHYRMADSYAALGRHRESERELVAHLDMRGPGCRSIYPLNELNSVIRHRAARRGRKPARRGGTV